MRTLATAVLLLLTAPSAWARCYDPNAARDGGPLGALAMAIGQPCPGIRSAPTQSEQMQQMMLQRM